jgi:GNAT superfamily N-acetyltransferase
MYADFAPVLLLQNRVSVKQQACGHEASAINAPPVLVGVAGAGVLAVERSLSSLDIVDEAAFGQFPDGEETNEVIGRVGFGVVAEVSAVKQTILYAESMTVNRGGEVRAVEAASAHFDAVIELSKKHQATLGQLPFAAFRAFADNGRLLGLFDGATLLGYVIYRRRGHSGILVLVHLCVARNAPRQGVARRLIEAIEARHPTAPAIAAWCREDYPATKAWPQLGFAQTSARPGKNAAGLRLLSWWRPINDQTLFTFDPDHDDVPAAALDANVFQDLVAPRIEFPESMALGDDWLTDVVKLVVTFQLISEINAGAKPDPALTSSLERFARMSPPTEQWEAVLKVLDCEDLRNCGIDIGDLRHLAQASAGGARYFVTRDNAVVQQAEVIDQLIGLIVLTPADLLLHLHADQFESAYRPEALLETSLKVNHPTAVPSVAELVAFTEHDAHERSTVLHSQIRNVVARVANDAQLWTIVRPDSEVVVLATTTIESKTLRIHLLRVRHDSDRLTFARQMLHLLRQAAVQQGLELVVSGVDAPTYLGSALADEGFRRFDDRWEAACATGLLNRSALVPCVDPPMTVGDLPAGDVSMLEKTLWPLKLITGHVPTYIVPIQPAWAQALFGREQQPTLFERPHQLALAREHVYYRSHAPSLRSPARLLWFVTGGGANGGMRATSWLDDVVHGRPRSLFRRFEGQGIYQSHHVEGLVNKPGGRATAMVFSRTEILASQLRLAQAREIFPPIGTSQYLRTMREVTEQVFVDFYTMEATQSA